MKIRTKFALFANIVIIGFSTFLYFNKFYKDTAEQLAEQSAIEAAVQQADYEKQLECISKNIYFEARNEGEEGERAVAWVTLNRVVSDKYPDTPCDVVYQAKVDEHGNPLRNKCSFSWFCDGKNDTIKNNTAWKEAKRIAADVMAKYGKETDPTGGAIMYHADYVKPKWAKDYTREVQINTHIFYVKG